MVLSFPYALRYRLAYDARMVSDVLGIFTRTVFGSLIRRASQFGAIPNAQCGAVTFIQRFGSALNLNLHVHMLAIDGIYAADDDGNPQFQEVQTPEDREIARLTASLAEAGWVEMPDALSKKYPNAGRERPRQWVFPATRTYAERVRPTPDQTDTKCDLTRHDSSRRSPPLPRQSSPR